MKTFIDQSASDSFVVSHFPHVIYRHNTVSMEEKHPYPFTQCNGKIALALPDDIVFVKSDSNYSIIYFKNGRRVLTCKTLKHWQEKLKDSYSFIRCHASFLVNINCIHSFDRSSKSIELSNDSKVVCSRRKCNEVIKVLKKNQSIQWLN